MMTTALIYCRISRDPAGTELGVKRQETSCRELAEREGLQVIDVLVDDDRSAYTGKPRPAWAEAIERVKNGGIDVLVAWHPDRLTRHTRELEDLIDLLEATSTTVLTVQAGLYDLTTPNGRMVARMTGAVARHESEHKSARLRAKALELAEAGKVGGGGHRCFGFESDRITVNQPEAEAIQWAAQEIVEGASLRSVCRRMPISTVRGGEWAPPTLARILTAPRTAGLRQHRGEVVGEAVWDAILDRETWERVRQVLQDPRRRTNRPSPRYLLTGGVAVDQFDRKLIARPNGNGVRCYISEPEKGKPGVRIEADPLERMVLDFVESHLRCAVPLVESTVVDNGSEAIEAVEAIEAEISELARLRGEGVISTMEWLTARSPLGERLRAAQALLGPIERRPDLGEVLARWDQLEHEERRRVVARYARVVVLPAVRGRHGKLTERVAIEWKTFGDVVRF